MFHSTNSPSFSMFTQEDLKQKKNIMARIKAAYYNTIEKLMDKIELLETHTSQEVRTKATEAKNAIATPILSYIAMFSQHFQKLETEGNKAIEKALNLTMEAITHVKPIVDTQLEILEKVEKDYIEDLRPIAQISDTQSQKTSDQPNKDI